MRVVAGVRELDEADDTGPRTVAHIKRGLCPIRRERDESRAVASYPLGVFILGLDLL